MTMGDVEISDISDGPVNKHGQGQAKMAAPALLLVLRDRMMDRSSAHQIDSAPSLISAFDRPCCYTGIPASSTRRC